MILCSGCFDALHYGHLQYLKRAERMCREGEPLVVALAADDYLRDVKHRRAFWVYEERRAVLEHLTFISRVVAHNRYGAANAILALKPRLFVKGVDWEGRIPDKVQEACKRVGCDIVFVNSEVHRHTSDALSA